MDASLPRSKRRRMAQNADLPVQPASSTRPMRQNSMRQLQISSLLKVSKVASATGRAKRNASRGKEDKDLSGLFAAVLADSGATLPASMIDIKCNVTSAGKGLKREACHRPVETSGGPEKKEVVVPNTLVPCQKRRRGLTGDKAPLPKLCGDGLEAVEQNAGTAGDVTRVSSKETELSTETVRLTSGVAEAGHDSGDSLAIIGGIDEAFAEALFPPHEESGKGDNCPPPAKKRSASQLLREMREKSAAAAAVVTSARVGMQNNPKELAAECVPAVLSGPGNLAPQDLPASKGDDGAPVGDVRGGWGKPWELANSVTAPLRGFKSRGAMIVGLAMGKSPPVVAEEVRCASPVKRVGQTVNMETAGVSGRESMGPSPRKGVNCSPKRRLQSMDKKVLPDRLSVLESQFVALETARTILKMRRQVCTWERVSSVVEGMTNRRFSLTQLAQLCHVLHDGMRLERVRLANPDDALNLSAAVWDIDIDILDPPSAPLSGCTTAPTGTQSSSSWRQILRQRLEQLATSLPEDAPLPEAELPRAPPPPQYRPVSNSPTNYCTPTPKRPPLPPTRDAASTSPYAPHRQRHVSPAPSLSSPVSAPNADLAGARRNLQTMLLEASKLPTTTEGIPLHADTATRHESERPDGAEVRIGKECECEGKDATMRVVESFECGGDEILRVLPADLLRLMQEKAQAQAKENSIEAVSKRRRGQMLEQLPKMLDVLKSVFQRADRTVYPRQQLLSQLLAPHRGIIDRKEVEEQLELMLELAPEWFTSKKSLSGEILYRIDKTVNVSTVRRKLLSSSTR